MCSRLATTRIQLAWPWVTWSWDGMPGEALSMRSLKQLGLMFLSHFLSAHHATATPPATLKRLA